MADEGEFTGKTVDDAIGEAEQALGVGRDQLEIDVVSQGSRGVFGIGAEPARVRARPRGAQATAPPSSSAAETVQTAPAPAPTSTSTPAPVATSESASAALDEERPSANGSDADLVSEATEVLRLLLENMGFDGTEVSVRSEEDPLMLAVTGSNLGVLIGRRGDNLAALQFMVNLILSKNRRQWPRVVIDVENYRARREESLRTLADRMAYRVRRNRRPFTLEAMPASDRRIIHLALRDRPDVETYSIGEGPARRVVIAPKRADEYRDEEPERSSW